MMENAGSHKQIYRLPLSQQNDVLLHPALQQRLCFEVCGHHLQQYNEISEESNLEPP